MTRGRPTRYTNRMRFMVEVLYLHGLSFREVSAVMGHYSIRMPESTVRMMVAQLPYRKAEMPAAVRQRLLDRLKEHRLDRNHGQPGLPDDFYIAKES